ncbi:WD40 repeat-like protein [Suillus weaverae]|nr:WD40 repeat-like protein [Suillus weaverae]
MTSSSTKAATTKSILTPSVTFQGHGSHMQSIAYFPDGQRIISGSVDNTTRQWDVKTGKGIEEAREICETDTLAVAVSRDGRWAVSGGDRVRGVELKACEVETGIVKKLRGHSQMITCIDISVDNMLLASGACDLTIRIWNLKTGKLMAGPFKNPKSRTGYMPGTIRFSTDSKKLAAKSAVGNGLEVWDVQSQKLDVSIGELTGAFVQRAPVFWTNKNKNILTSFSFIQYDVNVKTIYEFDSSTLAAVNAPFEGHTKSIAGLALSLDSALLVSTARDHTIKLWAFESRQLLASFDVQNPIMLILSLNSRNLAYVTVETSKIYICNTPPNSITRKKRALSDLLNSDATRRPAAGPRRPPIRAIPMVQRPPPTMDLQQPIFVRLSKLLRFSPRTNPVHPVRNDQPRDPLDFSATLPLPCPLSGHTSTQGRSHMNSSENSRPLSTTRSSPTPPTTFTDCIHHLSSWWPVRGGHAQPCIVDVPLAQAKEAC